MTCARNVKARLSPAGLFLCLSVFCLAALGRLGSPASSPFLPLPSGRCLGEGFRRKAATMALVPWMP